MRIIPVPPSEISKRLPIHAAAFQVWEMRRAKFQTDAEVSWRRRGFQARCRLDWAYGSEITRHHASC